MNSALRTQVAQAVSTLQAVAGVAVTYHRANGGSVALTGVPSKTDFFTLTPYGDQVRSQSADWVFPTLALVDAGVLFRPERGDQVVVDVVEENARLTFEVAEPQGDDLYRFTDPQRAGVRVFTNIIKREDLAP